MALDVWMVMSLLFIILAMLETVFVTWMYQRGEQNEVEVRGTKIRREDLHFFPISIQKEADVDNQMGRGPSTRRKVSNPNYQRN